MSYKLKEATFRVRCRQQGCPFNSDFTVKQNILGATEKDVDDEAAKIALNIGRTNHDAIYGRNHGLFAPEIKKVGGKYEQMGATPASMSVEGAGTPTRQYRMGDKIIRKGESATTLCEVVHGAACNPDRPEIVYRSGSTFGAAALLENRSRTADIVACEDDTVIGFYNLREITKTSPQKARELYLEAMQDIFNILDYLGKYADEMEKRAVELETEIVALKAGAGNRTAAAKKPAVAKKPAKPAAKKPAKKK